MYDQHPFFICTDEDRQFIRSEIGLKESTINEGVDALMDWFEKQPHLVDAGIDRVIVENTLILAKGSLETAKKRIDSFFKYRSVAPELIQGRDKILSDPEDLWGAYVQISMPKLFMGKRVTVLRLTDKDSAKFSGEILFRNTFMLGDLRLRYDYFLSDIWVVDMKNGSFSHLLKMNPMIMQKTAQIFHEGIGTRVEAIHILSANSLLQQVVSFMKQFFSPKLMNRIIIHDTVEDLHKYLPKQFLPKDYGGEQPYIMEFKDKYEKEMRSTRTKKYLIEASKMVSNESRRPNADKNEEYLVGSFRKLDFD